jgi:hypothetical protein
MRLAQLDSARCSTVDRIPVRAIGRNLPFVIDGAHTVLVSQGVAGRKHLLLGGAAIDRHGACWHGPDQSDRDLKFVAYGARACQIRGYQLQADASRVAPRRHPVEGQGSCIE